MIHKVKSVFQAVSVSLGEGMGFGLSLLDGNLYVGDPESLKAAGVKTIHGLKVRECLGEVRSIVDLPTILNLPILRPGSNRNINIYCDHVRVV